MAQRIPTFVTIGAVDRISKVLTRVRNKFPKLSRAARRASTAFAIMQKKTEKLRKSLSKMGRKMKSVGRSMTTGMTAPIGFAAFTFVKMAANFQGAMNRVGALSRTIVKGKVSPAFDEMTKKARALGETTAFSATQVAEGMGFLAQAGFKADQIINAITPTLNLASAANLDLATTADIASNIMGGFQLKAEEMTRVADVLALTTATSNTNLEQMGDAMKDAAPLAQKFGVSIENTAALVGMLGNIGIQGSKAGTTLKAMFTKLAAPSAKAQKMMKAFGFSLADSNGNIRPMNDILKELGTKIGRLNQQDQLKVINELFGLRGIAGGANLLAQAMKKGKNPIEAFTEQMKNSKGTAQDMANTMLRGAPGAFKKFSSAFESMAIAIAESGLLEAVTGIALNMTELFKSISQSSPGLLKWGTILIGVAALLGPVIWIIGVLTTSFGALMTVLAFLKAVMIGIAGVMALVTAPVWLIVAAVVGLVAILTRAFFAWDKLVSAFKSGKGFFGTIASVGKAFLGFGGDETEKPKVGDGAKLGADIGAKKAVRNAAAQSSSTVATNNAAVEITLKGDTKGVRTKTSGTAPLTLATGLQGGLL